MADETAGSNDSAISVGARLPTRGDVLDESNSSVGDDAKNKILLKVGNDDDDDSNDDDDDDDDDNDDDSGSNDVDDNDHSDNSNSNDEDFNYDQSSTNFNPKKRLLKGKIMSADQPRSSSSLLPTSRRFWFHLLDLHHRPITSTSKVTVLLPADVDDLRDAIQVKYTNGHLKGIDSSDLYVYKNITALRNRDEPLTSSRNLSPIGGGTNADEDDDVLGLTEAQALVVVVPLSLTEQLANLEKSSKQEVAPVLPPSQYNALINALTLNQAIVLPAFQAMDQNQVENIRNEIVNIENWHVDVVHEIKAIKNFMEAFGGCTNGRIYWREEEKQIFSFIVNNVENPREHKVILHGSPGVGKSVMICLVTLYKVLIQKKNILLLRYLNVRYQGNLLLYMTCDDENKCMYFSQINRTDNHLEVINSALEDQSVKFMLLLDGFVHSNIPSGLKGYKVLATSQGADLKSHERAVATKILHPCWKEDQIMNLGSHVLEYDKKKCIDLYYYSGGSVREFKTESLEKLKISMSDAVKAVQKRGDLEELFTSQVIADGVTVDRIRRTFVKETHDIKSYTNSDLQYQIIDSEYAIVILKNQLKLGRILNMFYWAKLNNINSVAGTLFEMLMHRLGSDSKLRICITEYDKNAMHQYSSLTIKQGKALHIGTNADYHEALKTFQDDKSISYWYPTSTNFPCIDSVVKLTQPEQDHDIIAYLQVTVADRHQIDDKHIKTFDDIFPTQPSTPIYIALCPDRKAADSLTLERANVVAAVKGICNIYVGYAGLGASGQDNNIVERQVIDVPKPHAHGLTTRRKSRSKTAETEKETKSTSNKKRNATGKKKRKAKKSNRSVKSVP